MESNELTGTFVMKNTPTIWTTRTEYIDSDTGEILKPSYAKKHYIITKTKKDYERISAIECKRIIRYICERDKQGKLFG